MVRLVVLGLRLSLLVAATCQRMKDVSDFLCFERR